MPAEHILQCDCDGCLNRHPVKLATPPHTYRVAHSVVTAAGVRARQRELEQLRRAAARKAGPK